jgi:hypothetical protein
MMKNSLAPNKGLSLSQAQSISNLCNQRAREISAQLSGVNNYSKSVSITIAGSTKEHIIQVGKNYLRMWFHYCKKSRTSCLSSILDGKHQGKGCNA